MATLFPLNQASGLCAVLQMAMGQNGHEGNVPEQDSHVLRVRAVVDTRSQGPRPFTSSHVHRDPSRSQDGRNTP
eukprot:2354855-Alexandrium_andersonii.AAC.1